MEANAERPGPSTGRRLDGAAWRARRPEAGLLHLDSAAAGRTSEATLAAVAEHARLESRNGAYVAEESAQEVLEGLRGDLAGLVGTDAEGVALVQGAAAGLLALIDAWPLRPGARVGVAPASWGPNLEILRHRGLVPIALEVDGSGVLDLEALETRLRADPPDLLLVDQVAAHRGLVQPVDQVVALGRAAGAPVWVDAAQSLGHLPLAAADAVFATGRKWLTGPRGVGMVAVAAQHREGLRVWRSAGRPSDLPTVRHLEPSEAHVAGRVGLAVAVREHLELGPEQVAARLVEVGRLTREALASMPGWRVSRPEAPAAAITSVVATAGQDVVRTRERLLVEHGILTTTCLPWRAPLEEPDGPAGWPLLRISPHVDLTADDLERLCRALADG